MLTEFEANVADSIETYVVFRLAVINSIASKRQNLVIDLKSKLSFNLHLNKITSNTFQFSQLIDVLKTISNASLRLVFA